MRRKVSSSYRFTEEDVRKFALEFYGVDATVRQLVSEMDQNFHLKDKTEKEYIFKIANPSRRREILDLQNKALDFLSKNDETIRCPQVCKTLTGKKITFIENGKRKKFYAWMLTYIKGRFFAEIDRPSSKLLLQLGHFIGSLDKTLARFHHPAAHRELPWDLKNALHSSARISCIDNSQQRRLVEYFLLQFETLVNPVLLSLPRSIIHNDVNDYNIIVESTPSGADRIAGIIDFGDMVHTHTVCELAIALTYALFNKDDPLEAAGHIVRGYHQVFPLTEKEIKVLFYLIGARLCISLTMSAFRKTVEPDNAYFTISEKPAWKLLEKFLKINPQLAYQTFKKACGQPVSTKRMTGGEILKTRHKHLSHSLSLHYKKPLHIPRGALQYLYDDKGQTYLDCVNNVCHVGHCHPRVVKAAQQQMAMLNTNTRYLHEHLAKYAQRLCALMPKPLSICFVVNSGSEANDLALRLANTYTGQKDVIVVDGAYHGHLSSLIQVSPYKFDGPGGKGALPHIHKIPTPDIYRGVFKANDPEAGKKYALYIQEAVEKILRDRKKVAAFMFESLMGCAGQIVYPQEYLKEAFQHVKMSGGVCIADEVQVGFGRLGRHFWGFESQDVVPDIVTLGKPIGNGHPLAAVITTPEIAQAFETGMEYFNTYGGNPVSCAVGMAVLDVIKDEKLQENAYKVGTLLKSRLQELKRKHEIIGDVRGMGLFLGVELVLDRQTLAPAAEQATEIIERMKDRGILLSTDGPLANVLKIKPPLVFTDENGNDLVDTLDIVLSEL